MEQRVLDSFQTESLDYFQQLTFRFHTKQYQVDRFIRFLKFETRLPAGVSNLDDLICNWDISPYQDISVQGGYLVVIHWSSPSQPGLA